MSNVLIFIAGALVGTVAATIALALCQMAKEPEATGAPRGSVATTIALSPCIANQHEEHA